MALTDFILTMRPTRSGQTLRACAHCGAGFEVKRPWQRFCSNRCRLAWHREHDPRRLNVEAARDLEARLSRLEARVAELEQAAGLTGGQGRRCSTCLWWQRKAGQDGYCYHDCSPDEPRRWTFADHCCEAWEPLEREQRSAETP